MLILAGVSINLVLGPNGLITKAQEAALQTDKASLNEKIQMAIVAAQMEDNEYKELTAENLGSALIQDGTKAVVSENEDGTIHILFLGEKKEYRLNSNGNLEELNIDFDSKYVAPASQDEERNEGVIGIGTDGKPVDMDLWNWTYDETTGGYALNTKEVLEETVYNAGYIGHIINGEIQGTIPAYIKDNGNEWNRVTNLNRAFYHNTELTSPPILPNGIVDISGTFNGCEKLESTPKIPESVVNMHNTFINCPTLISTSNIPNKVEDLSGTFAHCINLENVLTIGKNVRNMNGTFLNCTSLNQQIELPDEVTILDQTFAKTNIEIAPEIPSKVISMRGTFKNCNNLKKIPSIIPNSVENMQWAFEYCTNISGEIKINANVTGKILENGALDYKNCFRNACSEENCQVRILGSCSVLEEIVADANNSRIMLIY